MFTDTTDNNDNHGLPNEAEPITGTHTIMESEPKPKRRRTEKQIDASRLNGCKSKGPKTQQGKDISKMNAFRHGYYGELVLLPGESHSGYTHLEEAYLLRFQPADHSEFACVDQLVKLHWEMRRAWTDQRNSMYVRMEMQRRKFDLEFEGADPSLRITRAHETELSNGEFGHALERRLERLDRSYDRTLRRLHFIRTHFPLPSDYPTDLCERFDRRQNRQLLNVRNEPKATETPSETVTCEQPQPAPEPAAAAQLTPKRIFTPPLSFSYLEYDPQPVAKPEIDVTSASEPPPERPKTMTAGA